MNQSKDDKYYLNTEFELWRNIIPKNLELKITKTLTQRQKQGETKINQQTQTEENKLGKGFSGIVYKVQNEEDGIYQACKIFNRIFLNKTIKLNGEMVKVHSLVKKELLASNYLRHENLLRAYELIDDQDVNFIQLIVELCDGELCTFDSRNFKFDNSQFLKFSLVTKISGQQFPDEQKLKRVFLEILNSVAQLHKLNLAHCDIKPQNIMLRDGSVRLADLGSLAWMDPDKPNTSSKDNGQGTPYFMAPEALSNVDKSRLDRAKIDVWALGATFFACAFGILPFELYKSDKVAVIPQNFNLQWDLVDLSYYQSAELRSFIEWIMNVNQEKRPSIFEIIEHTQIKSYTEKPTLLCFSIQKDEKILPKTFFELYGLNQSQIESFDDQNSEKSPDILDKISKTSSAKQSKSLVHQNACESSVLNSNQLLSVGQTDQNESFDSFFFIKTIGKTLDMSFESPNVIRSLKSDISSQISRNKISDMNDSESSIINLNNIKNEQNNKNNTKFNKKNQPNSFKNNSNKLEIDLKIVNSYKQSNMIDIIDFKYKSLTNNKLLNRKNKEMNNNNSNNCLIKINEEINDKKLLCQRNEYLITDYKNLNMSTQDINNDDQNFFKYIEKSIDHKHRKLQKTKIYLNRKSDSKQFDIVELKNILNIRDHVLQDCIQNYDDLNL